MKFKFKESLAVILAVLMLLSSMPFVAFGIDKAVTTQEELNTAVGNAIAGDVISINAAGTYKVPGVPNNITIEGAVDGVVFNCVGSGSIASIPNGVTFKNVAFNMGTQDYHGFQHAGHIKMDKCTINGKFFSYKDMTFTGCTFNQTASDYAMWCYAGNVTYIDCIFNCNGKFVNVYNEGNFEVDSNTGESIPWIVNATGCTFNSTKLNKAAFNVKATCGATILPFEVNVSNCTANENFPTKSGDATSKLVILNPFIQVDDRTPASIEANSITIEFEGKQVYPAPDVKPITVEVAEGVNTEISNAISNNSAVADFEDTKLDEAVDESFADKTLTVKVTLMSVVDNTLTFDVTPYADDEKISNDDINKSVTFRLPLTNDFNKIAKINHNGVESYARVKGEEDNKYIELKVNHFSEFGVTPDDDAPVAVLNGTEYNTLKDAFDAVNTLDAESAVLKINYDTEEAISTTYKFSKDLTITSNGPVAVDFGSIRKIQLIPTNQSTLTIDEDVTLDNIFVLGAYNTAGNTIINGNAKVESARVYGPDDLSYTSTLVINGTLTPSTSSNGGHYFRIKNNGEIYINGNNKFIDTPQCSSLFVSASGTKSGKIVITDSYVSLLKNTDDTNGPIPLNIELNNSRLSFEGADYSSFIVTNNVKMDRTSVIEIVKGFADFIIKEGAKLTIQAGGIINARTIDNRGTIICDLLGNDNPDSKVKLIDYRGSENLTIEDYGTVEIINSEVLDIAVDPADSCLYALYPLAKINNSLYATIEIALGQAISGDTIKLVNNCSESFTLPVGVKFDTAGYDYTGTVSAPTGYVVVKIGNVYSLVANNYNNTSISISTPEELVALSDYVKAGNTMSGKTIVLNNDIDMSSVANFTPIGISGKSFSGTFDGKDYTISNLKVSANAHYAGLFGSVFSATIKNLTIDGADVKNGADTNYTGVLAGAGYVRVENVEVKNSTVNGYEQVGGIIGYLSCGYIKNSTVDNCNIYGVDRAGGITGKVNTDSEYVVSFNTVKDTTVKAENTADNGLTGAAGLVAQIMTNKTFELSNQVISDNEIINVKTITANEETFNPLGSFRAGHFFAGYKDAIVRNHWDIDAADETIKIYNPNNEEEYIEIKNFHERAMIEGGVRYDTIAGAFEAATEGQKVLLIVDSDEDVTLPLGITFDINGKNYTGVVSPADGNCISVNDGVYTTQVCNHEAALNGIHTDSLADTISNAVPGDAVGYIKAGTYSVPNLSKNITIEGLVDGVVFNCPGSGSIASVPNGATFKNVKFVLGNSNYHGFQHAGHINMVGCIIDGLLFSYGDMTFTDCTFNQSTKEYHMWCYDGNVEYIDCTFYGNGKFINVYNEGNSKNHVISAEGCEFISTITNKAAFNVKASCGEKNLKYEVKVSDCTANENFPSPSGKPSDTLIVINKLIQVDDRTWSSIDADTIKIEAENASVYPVVNPMTIVVNDEKVSSDTAAVIKHNAPVVDFINTGLADSLGSDYAGSKITVKATLNNVVTGTLLYDVTPFADDVDVSEIVQGQNITFRLPVTSAFGQFAKVVHDEEVVYPQVKSENGSKYIELTVDHFSEFVVSPTNIVEIQTPADLVSFSDYVNNGHTMSGLTVVLANDIDMSSVSNFAPIGTSSNKFSGIFDGQGHTISNLKVDADFNYAGLFGAVFDATIKNLTIDGAEIKNVGTADYTGVVAGSGYARIENVTAKNSTVEGGEQVGGIIGYLSCGHIKNSTVDNCDISGVERVGGIAGKVNPDSQYLVSFNIVKDSTITADRATDNDFTGAAGLVSQIMSAPVEKLNTTLISDNEIINVKTITASEETFNPIGSIRKGYFYTDFKDALVRNHWDIEGADETVKVYNPNNEEEYIEILNFHQRAIIVGGLRFDTIAGAFEAATNGQTVLLLADSDENVTLPLGITFDTNGKAYTGVVSPDEGNCITFNEGVYTTQVCTHEAVIGSIHYDTLAEAITSANDGETIVVIRNIDTTATAGNNYYSIINKSITIDFDDYALIGDYDVSVFAITCKDVVFKNANIENTEEECDAIDIYKDSSLTLESGIVKAIYPVFVVSGAKFVMNGGTLQGDQGVYVSGTSKFDEATAIINGGKIESKDNAIYIEANNTTKVDNKGNDIRAAFPAIVTINGGELSAENCISVYGKGATVNVNGGKISGTNTSIIGNGKLDGLENNGGTVINITGGTINGEIYHPQYGDITVSGGTITSPYSGIEMRAGNLTVTGGTIVSTSDTYSVSPSGNGATTDGAAIAIAQHTTKLPINVVITGGHLEAIAPLSEANPQKNDADAIANVSITVEDGEFKTINDGTVAIISEDIKNFVSGGTFSTQIPLDYCVNGFVPTNEPNEDGMYSVVEGNGVAKIVRNNLVAYFNTVSEAIENAQATETIVLIADVNQDVTLKAGVTIDTNGKTIGKVVAADGYHLVHNGNIYKTEIHSYTFEISALTCTQDKVKVSTCGVCGYVDSEVLEFAQGHKLEEVSRIEPTCTMEGTVTKKCTVCNDVFTISTPALEHDLITVTDKESCTVNSYRTITCSRCDYNKKELIRTAPGHDYKLVEFVPANCFDDGHEVSVCSVCKDIKEVIIEATGHDYLIVETTLTCTTDHIKTYTCKGCADKFVELIEKAPGHKPVHIEAVAPTCEKFGYEAYDECSVCGLHFTEKVEIDKLPHVDGNGDKSCDNCGADIEKDDIYNCNCFCHSNNPIWKLIYKIQRFFWKLFKTNKECDCGRVVHY